MSTRIERRVFLNTVVLGAGETVGQIANFAFVVLLARRYGVEVFGWYSFAMALGAVLSVFVGLGGTPYVTRELARDGARADGIFRRLCSVQRRSGLAVWTVIALLAFLSDVERTEKLVVVIVGAYHVLLRMSALHLAPSAARQRSIIVAIVGGGHRIVMAALVAVAILLGVDAPAALLAMPAAALLALVVARANLVRQTGADRLQTEPAPTRDVLRASLPFLGTTLLAAVYSRGGLLLLTAMSGKVATGLFAAGDRLLLPIYTVTAVFATALMPALAQLTGNPARLRELAQRCLRLVLLMSIPVSAVLAIFATEIVTLVFGPAMKPAAVVLALLSPLPVLRSVTTLWSTQCIATGAEHRMSIVKTQSIVAFFVCAPLGILAAGPAGLAVAWVGSETLYAFRLGSILATRDQAPAVTRAALAPALAAAAAAASSMFLAGMGLLPRTLLIGGVLLLSLVLFGAMRTHDLRFLLQILRGDRTQGAR